MKDQHQWDVLDVSMFEDQSIGLAVKNIIDEYISLQEYKRTSTRRKQLRIMNETYYKVASKLHLTDCNESFITKRINDLNSFETMYLFRIIIYLVEQKLIDDKLLARLVFFKSRFYWKGDKSSYYSLIKSKAFDVLRERGELIEEPKLLFASAENVMFFDEKDREILDSLLDDTKINTSWTPKSRQRKIEHYKAFAMGLLKDQSFKSLTRKDIANFLKINKETSKRDMVSLVEFLQFFNDKSEMSDDLERAIPYFDYLKLQRTHIDVVIEVFESDMIEQYIVITRPNEIYSMYYTDVPSKTALFIDVREFLGYVSYRNENFTFFIKNLYLSLGDESIRENSDLSFASFERSAAFFSKYKKRNFYSFIFAFFNFCYEKTHINYFSDRNLNIKILSKPGLARFMMEGYSIVKYAPIEPVPEHNKWLLYYQKEYESNTEHSYSECIKIDFDIVSNNSFRDMVKYYVWKKQKGIKSKQELIYKLAEILNYIDDLRTGKKSSIYYNRRKLSQSPEESFTVREAMAVRLFVSHGNPNNRTCHDKINAFKTFLRFLESSGYIILPKGVYHNLYHQNKKEINAKAIPDEHLEMINKYLLEKAEMGIQYELFYAIFYIALETEFRITQIVSLESDCVRESPGKKNEYVIISKKKDTSYEREQQPITLYVKAHIDHVLEITKNLREKADENLKSYLFLVPQKGTYPVRALRRENFRKFLKLCCDELGLPPYTSNNLRDTHMTKARELKIRKHMSDLEHSVLTGHKTSNIDMKHYVDMSIKTMMEAMHGVIIGNVELKGNIVKKLPPEIENPKNEVYHGCGFCKSPACTESTYLECLVCRTGDFVTTPSRLPYFEEQVKIVDKKIRLAKIPHDKEDQVNVKRLLVGYITAIKEFMKKEGDNIC